MLVGVIKGKQGSCMINELLLTALHGAVGMGCGGLGLSETLGNDLPHVSIGHVLEGTSGYDDLGHLDTDL